MDMEIIRFSTIQDEQESTVDCQFWYPHSRLQDGHLLLVCNHRDMQWRWNACSHAPHTGRQLIGWSLWDAIAWQVMHGSCKLDLQIKHWSLVMEYFQSATAFHCENEIVSSGFPSLREVDPWDAWIEMLKKWVIMDVRSNIKGKMS